MTFPPQGPLVSGDVTSEVDSCTLLNVHVQIHTWKLELPSVCVNSQNETVQVY